MSMSDPIAAMLTRVRNSILREHKTVSLPYSKIKESIAEVLKKEGFIESFHVHPEKVGKSLEIVLRYDSEGEPIIRKIKRVSRPGLRVFKGYDEIKPVLNGQGIFIITTSKGVLSDIDCRTQKIGGEILCEVY
ncbi:MAG: 30S ribosomal protein S8 [Deltaproteobacteria bacterium]|nr:30S ribosomal protein S8 [Deltaproteobacteria bacterium]